MSETDPTGFIEAQDEPRRSELRTLHDLITGTVPELEPELSGTTIGYGKYRYRYPSGREGDWYRVLLSVNRKSISIHVMGQEDGRYLPEVRAGEFPKAHVGQSCVRSTKLGDIDLDVLRTLIRDGASAPLPTH